MSSIVFIVKREHCLSIVSDYCTAIQALCSYLVETKPIDVNIKTCISSINGKLRNK